MPKFKPLENVMLAYKEKYVRYAGVKRKFRPIQSAGLVEIPRGAIGYCYSIIGPKMFVAFKENLTQAPMKSQMWANWKYHIEIYPLNDHNWEIEE